MYRYVDAALIRAAAYPSGLVLPDLPDLSEPSGDEGTDTAAWRLWLESVWRLQSVAEAVELASPVLAHRVRQICAGQTLSPKRVRRTTTSLHRYLLRLQHRATPFGLFAGIAPARIGPVLAWRWGEEHRPFVRVDAVWLSEIIGRLEACPDLLRRLTVVADGTSFARGGRWVLPCQRPDQDEDRGPGEVGIRRTPAVDLVLAAAASPVAVAALTGKLAAEYPDVPSDTRAGLLTELVARRFLLTDLRPPMTVTDTLGHLINRLDGVNAVGIAPIAPTVRMLYRLHATLTHYTTAEPAIRRRLRTEAAVKMRAATSVTETPLAVDLRLDCSLTLPEQVATEAEKAAEALARLTPFPSGSTAWREFHTRFLERYGPGALVPISDLTDPDTGIDLPAGYRGSLGTPSTPALTPRDHQLLALAQHAALDGAREIVLSDADLAAWEVGSGIPLPHLDLRFSLHAATSAALRDGDFLLVVSGVAPAAGATAGRFLDLLDADDRVRMTAAYASLPTVERGALRAQVSSPPLSVRTENVGRAPIVSPKVIPVADHPQHGSPILPLRDLAVTADASRLVLVQLSTGRTVEPAMLNAVDLKQFTHPLARLLIELPRARCAAFGPFAWGAAAGLPFLPRVRYGRAVLAPATWRIEAADLPGPRTPPAEWRQALSGWRRRLGVPEAVQLGDDDKRLRLILEHGADAALLRAEVDRVGHVTLREAPEEAAYGWCDGRPHEITLALASTASPIQPSTSQRKRSAPVGREHGQSPGASTCAYVKLYGHPDWVPELLTRRLPRLWEGWEDPPQWWLVRYRDPHDHVRLRFRLPHPDGFGAVAARVGAWASDLRQDGLLGTVQWDTYYPETGRYGSGPALDAAEAFFAADSGAAVAQMMLAAGGEMSAQAVTAASLVDLAIGAMADADAAMRWLIEHITTDAAPHPSRVVHQEAMRLASPRQSREALHSLPGGDRLTAAWDARREALTAYRVALAADGRLSPEAVLPSLMHMHHLRSVGIDQTHEQTCYRLARAAALAWTAQSQGAAK
ncbi:thiopeptide-type bacteriocin biosynthesis domain-containing protein [Streptomyces sp. DvalAA-14]|uniref:lantibiotic dehydratase n=1 Tax=unclassified Streptomyces TaxID=2593676 RepID=UPI00081BB559|nr:MULTISPECIES: lantibiotic dehydratase [unclassified Streptomyces]MYS19883.1 hypothetical protein [Streptomyces sp. SID4948]SCD55632.1 thiopeptide-type bacteriocin biosynthesis domain-containing protein [Streptomyces sp. DvalAA-14]